MLGVTPGAPKHVVLPMRIDAAACESLLLQGPGASAATTGMQDGSSAVGTASRAIKWDGGAHAERRMRSSSG
eukprot:scaffold241031_cov19-Tisochrysis_lutea.AAC.1